jgi:hypothetical protein
MWSAHPHDGAGDGIDVGVAVMSPQACRQLPNRRTARDMRNRVSNMPRLQRSAATLSSAGTNGD